MKLHLRKYQSEDDYWRIRNFLRDIFLLNDRRMLCWPVARFDYWRWHGILNLGDGKLEEHVSLWETDDRQIAAVLNREGAWQAFLQFHPAFKTAGSEEELLGLAEEDLPSPSRKGGLVLRVWSDARDSQRQGILERRGFTHIAEAEEHQGLGNLEIPVPDSAVRDGYIIRSRGEISEPPARSWASWRAVHTDAPDEKYDGEWTWYQNIQTAPLYRRDLDLDRKSVV